MARKFVVALLSLATAPAFLLFNQPAQAQRANYCYPDNQTNNASNNQGAYSDGYQEGRQSFRNGEAYKPRTAGGDFARGFYDGYYNRPFRYASGQCNIGENNRRYDNRDYNRRYDNRDYNRRYDNRDYNQRHDNRNDNRRYDNHDNNRRYDNHRRYDNRDDNRRYDDR